MRIWFVSFHSLHCLSAALIDTSFFVCFCDLIFDSILLLAIYTYMCIYTHTTNLNLI